MQRSFENSFRLLLKGSKVLTKTFIIFSSNHLKEKRNLLFAETKKRQKGRNFTQKNFCYTIVRSLAARYSNGSVSALFFGKISKITKRIPFMINDYV
jgi:hypothetical protein